MFRTQVKIRICTVAYLFFKNKPAINNKPFKKDTKFSILAYENLRAQGILPTLGKAMELKGQKPKRWKVTKVSLCYS